MTPVQTVNFETDSYEYELGVCADRATGSALVRSETLHILAIVDSRTASEATGFQLSTDFRLRASSIGRIPSNFLKRETRPSDAEILMSRLIDRSIRPQFPSGSNQKTVVSITLLGGTPGADILKVSLFAVSLALRNAGIRTPFILGETHVQPDALSLSIAVQENGLVMVEGGLCELSHSTLSQRLIARITALCEWCQSMEQRIPLSDTDVIPQPRKVVDVDCEDLWKCDDINVRRERRAAVADAMTLNVSDVDSKWSAYVKAKARKSLRRDGRTTTAIRPIDIRSNMSPTAHGAVKFSRGATTALVFATLGTSRELQDVPDLFYKMNRERLIVHYNFHPFATNQAELGRHMPNRREVGHGHLIKRSFLPLLPDKNEFPFAIRINSEIMSADGSSSMASVMGASLALAEAGIPIPRPIVGVSVGLFETDTTPVLFTDLTEDEDHASLFDLKVTGTSRGLTALQLDIKASYLDNATISEALEAACQGIEELIEQITPSWSYNLEQNLLLMSTSTTFTINRSDVGRVIGSGGKNLKVLQQATSCRIELSKGGTVAISAPTVSELRRAVHRVSTFSLRLQPGRLYVAQPGTAHLDGLHIKVGGHLGLIPDSRAALAQNDTVLVRYLRKRDDGVLEFERLDTDTFCLEQAMNAPVVSK